MKIQTLFNYLQTFTLYACISFCFVACSDDVVEPNNVDASKDTEISGLEYSNEALTSYIMAQFAELNKDGSLCERTTYFRQLDESDSTAIYTIAQSNSDARAKFLSLLPESYQKKVVVKNDSAEMSLSMGTSPLQISYKEGGTDGNVVATVQLPSQGGYTKIANTLTMVKSYGDNVDISYANKIVCNFEKIKIKVLTSNCPISLSGKYSPNDYNLKVETAELSMLCYNITPDHVAQYVFIPPLASDDRQLQLPSGNYLVGFFYPWMIEHSFKGSVDVVKLLKQALPSPAMVQRLTANMDRLGMNAKETETNINQNTLGKHLYRWFDEDKIIEFATDKDKRKNDSTTFYYVTTMQSFIEKAPSAYFSMGKLAFLNSTFPYQVDEFQNYKQYPRIPQYLIDRLKEVKDQPFFVNADSWWHQNNTEADAAVYTYHRAFSIATNKLYTRDKNDVVSDVTSVFQSESGEWTIVETDEKKKEEIKEQKIIQLFYEPNYGHESWIFKKKGRYIKNTDSFPLRVLYLYEKKL